MSVLDEADVATLARPARVRPAVTCYAAVRQPLVLLAVEATFSRLVAILGRPTACPADSTAPRAAGTPPKVSQSAPFRLPLRLVLLLLGGVAEAAEVRRRQDRQLPGVLPDRRRPQKGASTFVLLETRLRQRQHRRLALAVVGDEMVAKVLGQGGERLVPKRLAVAKAAALTDATLARHTLAVP